MNSLLLTMLKSLNASIIIDGKKYSIGYAIEKMIQSYLESMRIGKPDITLPELIDIEFRADE